MSTDDITPGTHPDGLSGRLGRLFLADDRRPAAGALPAGTEMRRYLLAALTAAVPCLALAAYWFGPRLWAAWAAAALGGTAVEVVVARVRRQPWNGAGLVYAAVLALLLPPGLPLWLIGLAMAAGTLFGKEAFGGTGSHLCSPALVAKGFLFFSYPSRLTAPSFGHLEGLTQAVAGADSALEAVPVPEAWLLGSAATLLAMLTMALARPSNLRILAAVFLAAVGVATGLEESGRLPYESVVAMLGADGFLVIACFLVCDPACSPRHDEAKWLYGLLIGALAVLMRTFSTYSEAMLCAAMLGSLAAPTLDLLAERRPGGPAA